jgi:hypothetical protein
VSRDTPGPWKPPIEVGNVKPEFEGKFIHQGARGIGFFEPIHTVFVSMLEAKFQPGEPKSPIKSGVNWVFATFPEFLRKFIHLTSVW